uniref:Small ribosomal subunit protein bS16c n=1 Tax=Boldia erythrosiphon TaxID=74908 RepID=A0A1X9PUY4_9RHOD|nr:30S ribosomal protein S16 [Boldia erythrosiphon]ARO90523.1 30S ribosomal protein S16 [Boldia erythrosiphon]
MIKIRLKRCGRKKHPVYRIVVMDVKTKRNGKPIEEIGFYNPITKESRLKLERITQRLTEGAKLTKTANYIFNKYSKHNTQ